MTLAARYLLFIGSHPAYAQSNSNIARPRMLIRERDPLTGFNVLRARLAAGARPSDGIDGWALSYLLTRDESFAQKAVEEMRRTHPPELVGSRTYPEYVKWSLAFDWLYNYPGFDAATRGSRRAGTFESCREDDGGSVAQRSATGDVSQLSGSLSHARGICSTAIEGHPSVEARSAAESTTPRKFSITFSI